MKPADMEIIILPYLAISFLIAWAIFSPFAEIDDLHDWTFAKIELSDLFAIFLPCSFLLSLLKWATAGDDLPTLAWTLIGASILLLSIFGFVTGLFLLAKMNQKPPLKRMAIIGVIVPIGSLLTLAWIAFPVSGWACKIDSPAL